MNVESVDAGTVEMELKDGEDQFPRLPRYGFSENPDLPSTAHADQSGVPPGSYRKWNRKIASLAMWEKTRKAREARTEKRKFRGENVSPIESEGERLMNPKLVEKALKTWQEQRYVSRDNRAKCGQHTFMVPRNEQVLIKVDKYSDEMTCKACRGLGHGMATCPECAGTKKLWADDNGNIDKRSSADRSQLTAIDCPFCECSSYQDPVRRSTGSVPCKDCRGTGQNLLGGAIATSGAHEEKPSTGIVVAVGSQCKELTIGDRLLFEQFAGKSFQYEGREYRLMRETYPLAFIIGNEDIRVKTGEVMI